MFKFKDQVVPAFYEMKDYVPEIDRRIPRNLNREYLHFSEKSRPYFEEIMHYFSEVTFERMGVLHGEYALSGAQILVRQDGMNIKANMAREDRWSPGNNGDYFCSTEEFIKIKNEALEAWDSLPILHSPIILHQLYGHAYFHWSFEVAAKMRLFAAYPDNMVVVHFIYMNKLFQTDLLNKVNSTRPFCIQTTQAIRVKDPIVSHEVMSEDGVLWLRKTMNIPTTTGGNRRIYLRRTPGTARERAGGGLCETAEFIAFLKEFKFESIDFSDREMTVEEQVRLLDNVSIILAPHGGALTNLAYLNPPLSVIEVVSHKTPRAMFMHIASILKFQYYGVFSSALDEHDNIMVDMDELRDIMRKIV